MVDEGRSRLGRGLAALMGDMASDGPAAETARTGARKVPTAFLRASPLNPRRAFHEEGLEALAQSVREKGIIQPILVRAVPNERDRFEIIAGERRWRAAQRVGLHEVPIVLVEASDQEALELAIIENVQRADLDPLEEARGYERLVQEFAYTQERLAKAVGKSRSHIANTLRLLTVSDTIKAHLQEGALTAGHVRAIMTASNPEALAERIVRGHLSVRQAEELAQGVRPGSTTAATGTSGGQRAPEKDADTRALEQALSDALGLVVEIDHKGAKGGRLAVRYRTLDQLDAVCRKLQSP